MEQLLLVTSCDLPAGIGASLRTHKLTTIPAPLLTAVTIVKFIFWPIGAVAIQERLQFKKKIQT